MGPFFTCYFGRCLPKRQNYSQKAPSTLRSLIAGLFSLPDEQIRSPRSETMESYKSLVPTKRKHPGADEGDAPAGQSTSSPHTATSTTTSRPVGCESPLGSTRPEEYVRKEVDPAHPRLIQTILSFQVATSYNDSAAQVLIGTGSQGMLSPCRGFTCILNHVFRPDSARDTSQHPVARRGRCPRSILTSYPQENHESTPPQT